MKKLLLLLCAMALVFFSYWRERTVSGKVTSTEDGSSLPGVNVILKGTTAGPTPQCCELRDMSF